MRYIAGGRGKGEPVTGKIAKVTIDLKEIRAAGAVTSEKDLREASSRKVLAD